MKDERTETWNPYELPERPSTPEWYPDSKPLEEPQTFNPRGGWIDRAAAAVRPH